VMVPGYVESANHVAGVSLRRDEWAGQLLAVVTFPMGWPAGLSPYREPTSGWQSWNRERSWSSSEAGEGDDYRFSEPREQDPFRPELLVMGTIVIPIPHNELPHRYAPQPWQDGKTRPGVIDVGDAKTVVSRVAAIINRDALPVLNAAIA